MDTSAPIRLLPYGNSDFETIRRANKYYVDKTMFIPALEKYDYQMFLRPRRFGKSLMLNMLVRITTSPTKIVSMLFLATLLSARIQQRTVTRI